MTGTNNDNPEYEFIQSVLTRELFPGHPVSDSTGLDWDRLYDLLIEQRLSSYFSYLGKAAADRWPASFRDRLQNDRFRAKLYGEQCSARIRELLSALRGKKIPVIVLKGWANIPLFYRGDPSLRICEDIDLLIMKKDADAVEEIALGLGLAPELESWPGYSRRYMNGRSYYYAGPGNIPGDRFWISVHWGLLRKPSYDPGRIDLQALFERALPLVVAGAPVLRLSREDDLVYACAHLGLHHCYDGRLFRYFEMAKSILAAGEDLRWDLVVKLVDEWRVVLPARLVLHRLDGLWSSLVPEEVLKIVDVLGPGRLENFSDKWNRFTRGKAALDQPLVWLTFPDWRQRPLIMLQDIFPAPEYLEKRYGPAPWGWWPLLYFVRIIRAVSAIFK